MWVVLILCFLLCDFCANKAHKGVTIATGDFVYSARQSSQDILHKEQTTKLDCYSYVILLYGRL